MSSYLTIIRSTHSKRTLFPYTTLFRSCHPLPTRPVRGPPTGRTQLPLLLLLRVRAEPARLPCARVRDRKSTRLNSSHVAISYAVFYFKIIILSKCLLILILFVNKVSIV